MSNSMQWTPGPSSCLVETSIMHVQAKEAD